MRNWWLKVNHFDYDASLPELCHQYLEQGSSMPAQAMDNLSTLANNVCLDGTQVTDMNVFVNSYLDVFNRGFQYAFMAAIVAMLISLVIYVVNKNRFPDPAKKENSNADTVSAVSREDIKMSATEIKQRIYALFAVFGVVIFFWLSFHQNGYSLTYFARDYVDLSVINIDLGFTQIKGAEIFQCVNPFFVEGKRERTFYSDEDRYRYGYSSISVCLFDGILFDFAGKGCFKFNDYCRN